MREKPIRGMPRASSPEQEIDSSFFRNDDSNDNLTDLLDLFAPQSLKVTTSTFEPTRRMSAPATDPFSKFTSESTLVLF